MRKQLKHDEKWLTRKSKAEYWHVHFPKDLFALSFVACGEVYLIDL